MSSSPTPNTPPTLEATIPETVIGPAPGWKIIDWADIWRYRELLFFLAWRDVKVRYKQTALGVLWAILQPTLLMLIFWMFLGKVGRVSDDSIPYPLFVFTGLLPWFLFATAVTAAGNSLIDSERLISKVYFPRLAVPFGAAAVSLVDFFLSGLVLAVLFIAYGTLPGVGLLLLPLVIVMIFITALGIGTFISALNVRYRDFRYAMPFMIQAWLFATPTIYLTVNPAEGLPTVVHWAMQANPMTGLIVCFRACLLGGPIPWENLGVAAGLGAAFFLGGCFYFRRMEDSFADII